MKRLTKAEAQATAIALHRQGLTDTEIATQLDRSPSTISDYLRGHRTPNGHGPAPATPVAAPVAANEMTYEDITDRASFTRYNREYLTVLVDRAAQWKQLREAGEDEAADTLREENSPCGLSVRCHGARVMVAGSPNIGVDVSYEKNGWGWEDATMWGTWGDATAEDIELGSDHDDLISFLDATGPREWYTADQRREMCPSCPDCEDTCDWCDTVIGYDGSNQEFTSADGDLLCVTCYRAERPDDQD